MEQILGSPTEIVNYKMAIIKTVKANKRGTLENQSKIRNQGGNFVGKCATVG